MGFQVNSGQYIGTAKKLCSIQQPRRFSRMTLNHQCPLLLSGWSSA